MRRIYYNRRKLSQRLAQPVLPCAALLAAATAIAAAQQQPASKPITTASLDSHDGVTIAADPLLSAERYKVAFPKKSPYAAGILGVKLTLRNDSNESLRLGIDRIRLNLTLDEGNRQELPALTSEQLADAVLHPRV